MPTFTGTNCAAGAPKARPRWELTRRVAFDADAEDEEDPMQRTQSAPTPQSQHEIGHLIEPAQNVDQSCARPKQIRSRSERRPTETSISQNSSKPQQRQHRTKAVSTSSPPTRPKIAVSKSIPAPSQEAKKASDDWIICERYKEGPGWYNGYYGSFSKVPDGIWDFRAARRQPKGSFGFIPKPKPKTKFTDLPPEIRNAIYQYAIPERSVLILRRHPNKEAESNKRYWSDEYVTRRPHQSRLIYEPEWDRTSEDFGTAIKLMLTCKKLRTEVETFLYSGVQFCFHNLKSLRGFLHTAPRSGIGAIRSVFIRQDGYGNSRAVEDQRYREKYYKGWERACAQLGEKATNLQHLKLMVCDREWPCVLSGKEYTPAWGESVLKAAPALLPKVEVRVHHKMIDRNQEVLKDLARRVEDSMMTLTGREERDRVETERVLAQITARKAAKEERERRRQAKLNAALPPTELVISMDDIQKHVGKTPTVNKVRREGLDKFTKITAENNPLVWYPGQNN